MQGLNGFIDGTLANDDVLIKVLFCARSLFFQNSGPKKAQKLPNLDQIIIVFVSTNLAIPKCPVHVDFCGVSSVSPVFKIFSTNIAIQA